MNVHVGKPSRIESSIGRLEIAVARRSGERGSSDEARSARTALERDPVTSV